jgi:DNA-binding winged helix-turn-helix (wHTH) protein
VPVIFGTCEFDSLRHELLRHGRPTPLTPRAFQLLELLLERRPEVIPKNELLEHLWPGTFVSDASLHNLVAEVRAAIGDTPRASRFIRTVPRCGYGFHGDVQETPTTAQPASQAATQGPQLVTKRREWSLSEGSNVVGRDPDCAVSLEAPSVSRRHARVVVTNGNATIEDLESKNGTFVNGRQIKDATSVEDGDQIQVGSVAMTYRRPSPLPSTLTQHQRKS